MATDALAVHLQLSVGDIATLAGVHPSAVSRWRKRAAEPFPEPISGGRSPLFSAAEALAWLRTHGGRKYTEPDAGWLWRQALRVLPASTPADEREQLRGYVASLVALGAFAHGLLDDAHSGPGMPGALPSGRAALLDTAQLAERQYPELSDLIVSGLDSVSPAPEIEALLVGVLNGALQSGPPGTGHRPKAADLLDAALDTLADLSPGATVTRGLLADLLAATVGPWPGSQILDPACGEGEVLLRLAGKDDAPLTLLGIDIIPGVTRTARIRLILHAIPATIVTADAIKEPPRRAEGFDIVIIDPPSSARTGTTQGWLKVAMTALKPGGRAAVALPAAALRANAAGDSVLRHGHVAAAILLPPLVRHGVRDTQAVAVLTTAHHDRILAVDLSGRLPAGTPAPVAEVAELVNAWLDDPNEADRALGDFTRRTHTHGHVLTNHDVQVGGVVRPTRAPLPTDVKAALVNLQQVLADHPELTGTDKLTYVLDHFAKTHHIPAVG